MKRGGDFLNLGEKIYKLRKACNLSQAKLAYKIEIYPDRISNYETGLYVPSLRNLINITQNCNVSIKDFLKEVRKLLLQKKEKEI